MGLPREWLYHVQTTLNDAHMQVTDAVSGRSFSADEIVMLERIDMAIMHVHAMREFDHATSSQNKLRVRSTP